MELVPLVVVSVIGLGIGIWLGMPGRDRPSAEDVERAMDSGAGRASRRRRAKRSINPLAWVQRKAPPKSARGPRSRKGFKLESPDERD